MIDEDSLRTRVKRELRTRMKSVRRALPKEARAARSARVCGRVLGLGEFASAKVVLSFIPVRGEVDPTEVVTAAHAQGKTVALPRVDMERGALVLHRYQKGDRLEEAGYGIPEPLPTAPTLAPHEVELVLVPGLAFDERGHRIGYGKGFYDRLLPTMTQATSVAIGYDFQLLSEVPEHEHDHPVDIVVTDARTLRTSAVHGG